MELYASDYWLLHRRKSRIQGAQSRQSSATVSLLPQWILIKTSPSEYSYLDLFPTDQRYSLPLAPSL